MTTIPPVRRGAVRRIPVRTARIIGFVLFYVWEFLKANATVLWEIFTPGIRATPAVIALPLRCRRPVEIASMANLISLTPGTLALEVALDPPTLYVHGMFVADPDGFVADLRVLEDRLLAAMRPVDSELERR